MIHNSDDYEVYLEIQPLPASCTPAHVVRHAEVTLILIDPHAHRIDVLGFLADRLAVDEQNAVRDGMGWPLVGGGLIPDAWIDGSGWFEVPTTLTLEVDAGSG